MDDQPVSLGLPGYQARRGPAAEGEPVSPRDELNSGLLQLGTWNIQGKPLELAVSALHDFGVDLHLVAFQEVGSIRSDGHDSDVALLEIDDLILLVAKPSGCCRHVALGLDADCLADWSNACVGHSHLSCAVRVWPFEKNLCVVSVHLPHQGRPLADFHAALSSLEDCLRPFVRKSHPIVVLGDLNLDLCRGSGDRFTALHACLHHLGLVQFSSDSMPTWGARRVDHIVCNSLVLDRCLALSGHPACPWAGVEVRNDLKQALGVDHGFLLHELLLRGVGCSSRRRRASRYLAFLNRPCKMHFTNGFLLQQKVYAFMDSAMCGALPDSHQFLTDCARSCTSRTRGLPFLCVGPGLCVLTCRSVGICLLQSMGAESMRRKSGGNR